MIENLPEMGEWVAYALTFWAFGFVAGKKLMAFIQLMERAG